MNASTDVLQTLNQLSAADRNWIIERLPAQSKTRLLAISSPRQPAAAPAPVAAGATTSDAQQLLRHADPTTLANLLQREPPWLASALLQSHAWPWREALLAALPPGVRAEVERGSQTAYATRLTDTLLGIIAARMEVHAPAPPVSKFEILVEKLAAARSRKRWSINL